MTAYGKGSRWSAARESLALPIYGELTGPQQATVVESVRSFYRM